MNQALLPTSESRNRVSCYISGLIAIIFMGMVLLGLQGCAEKVFDEGATQDQQVRSWESESGLEIRWVKEIRGSRGAGLKEGFWQRVKNVLFGRDNQFIARPYGIYAEDSRLLCISDPGSGKFHLYDIEKGKSRVLDRVGDMGLSSPLGITGDGKGTLFLTDSALGRIFRYDSDKNSLKSFSETTLQRPTGIAFNPDNWQIYVADTLAHQVVVFGLDGVERFRIGQRGPGPGAFNFPTDLWIDSEGRLLVTDSLNARVQVFSPRGEFLTLLGSRGHAAGFLDKPKGVATDSAGRIYVCDALKDSVQVFSPEGVFLLRLGERGQAAGQFWMPAGLFIDGSRIYVSDSYNQRIQVFEIVEKLADGQ